MLGNAWRLPGATPGGLEQDTVKAVPAKLGNILVTPVVLSSVLKVDEIGWVDLGLINLIFHFLHDWHVCGAELVPDPRFELMEVTDTS